MDSLEKDIAPTVVLYLFGIRDIMLYIFFSADSISGDKKELGVRKIVVSYKTWDKLMAEPVISEQWLLAWTYPFHDTLY